MTQGCVGKQRLAALTVAHDDGSSTVVRIYNQKSPHVEKEAENQTSGLPSNKKAALKAALELVGYAAATREPTTVRDGFSRK